MPKQIEKLPIEEVQEITKEDGKYTFIVEPEINKKTVVEKINELIEVVNEQFDEISTIKETMLEFSILLDRKFNEVCKDVNTATKENH